MCSRPLNLIRLSCSGLWRPVSVVYERLWIRHASSRERAITTAVKDRYHVGKRVVNHRRSVLPSVVKGPSEGFLRGLMSDEGGNMDFRKENVWTVPNLLSVLRIVSTPVLGGLVLMEHYTWAFGILVAAGVTDLMDGIIARRYPSQASRLGSVLDPLADKCLISILCIALTINNIIPLSLTALILSRDLLLIGASFYIRFISIPQPRTWSKYWDLQRSSIQITPTFISKVNTVIQLSLVTISSAAPVFHYTDHLLLHMLWYTTALTTIGSGVDYMFQTRGFRVLKKRKRMKKHHKKL